MRFLRKLIKVNSWLSKLFSKYFNRPLTISSILSDFNPNNEVLQSVRDKKISVGERKETVGVLITSYNNEKTISGAIYSALNQTRKPDVIYVADDCSSDNSVLKIKSISKQFSDIHLIERPDNIGVSANRDHAIREMAVDYITTLDGDDLFFPEKIELELNALNGSKSKVAFSDILVVRKKGKHLLKTAPYSQKKKDLILPMLTSRSEPVPRDMLFPKDLFYQAHGFDVVMNIYEDWAFKMRLMEAAGENGWVYSGGAGTIYDRRNPGLSDVNQMEHAFWQLYALARNTDMLSKYPEAIRGGLLTVANFLSGEMLGGMKECIEKLHDPKGLALVCDNLNRLWTDPTCNKDHEQKIKNFINSILIKI